MSFSYLCWKRFIRRQADTSILCLNCRRAKLYLDGTKLVDNDGLHPPQEKCGSRTLVEGNHLVYIKGFQAGGGVEMVAKYSGPDTAGRKVFLRSGLRGAPKYFESCDPSKESDMSKFTVCVFKTTKALSTVPCFGSAGTTDSPLQYLGKGKASKVDMHSGDDFRAVVAGTPNENFAWVIFGQLQIQNAGSYELCIRSDDG